MSLDLKDFPSDMSGLSALGPDAIYVVSIFKNSSGEIMAAILPYGASSHAAQALTVMTKYVNQIDPTLN